MDIQDYFIAICGLFYKYIYPFVLVIIEFYGIFGNIMHNIMKKLLKKQTTNDKKDQMHEIMIKYQLQKTFMALYIDNTMILYELLLNIAWKCMTLYVLHGFCYRTFYIKIKQNKYE